MLCISTDRREGYGQVLRSVKGVELVPQAQSNARAALRAEPTRPMMEFGWVTFNGDAGRGRCSSTDICVITMASKLAPWAVRSSTRALRSSTRWQQRSFCVSASQRSDSLNVVCHYYRPDWYATLLNDPSTEIRQSTTLRFPSNSMHTIKSSSRRCSAGTRASTKRRR